MNPKRNPARRPIAHIALLVAFLHLAGPLHAAGPGTISYQGTVVDPQGVPPPNADYSVHFALYDAPTEGNLLWEESHLNSVVVSSGVFSVALGGQTPFPDGLFHENPALWLEIQVDLDRNSFETNEIYAPRVPFTAAPYAFQSDRAATADKLGGKSPQHFLAVDGGATTGTLTIDTPSPHALVARSESVAIQGFSGGGTEAHVQVFPFLKSGGEFVGPNGLIAVTTGEDELGTGVIGAASNEKGTGVLGYSTGSAGTGVHGFAATTTGTATAVYGQAESPNAVGGHFTNTADGGVAIKAGGTGVIQSAADSYIWIPATNGFAILPPGMLNVEKWFYGRVRLSVFSPGVVVDYYFPVNTPSVLYGQNVKIKEVTLYYFTSHPQTFITGIDVYVLTGADTGVVVMSDPTDHASVVPAAYSITPAQDVVLSSASGPVTVRVYVSFASALHSVYIGAVRIRLGHE